MSTTAAGCMFLIVPAEQGLCFPWRDNENRDARCPHATQPSGRGASSGGPRGDITREGSSSSASSSSILQRMNQSPVDFLCHCRNFYTSRLQVRTLMVRLHRIISSARSISAVTSNHKQQHYRFSSDVARFCPSTIIPQWCLVLSLARMG